MVKKPRWTNLPTFPHFVDFWDRLSYASVTSELIFLKAGLNAPLCKKYIFLYLCCLMSFFYPTLKTVDRRNRMKCFLFFPFFILHSSYFLSSLLAFQHQYQESSSNSKKVSWFLESQKLLSFTQARLEVLWNGHKEFEWTFVGWRLNAASKSNKTVSNHIAVPLYFTSSIKVSNLRISTKRFKVKTSRLLWFYH